MNIKSNKAITMVSLVIYVISFLVITGIVGSITYFFYGNVNSLNSETAASAEYNKLNLYLANDINEEKNGIESFSSNTELSILKLDNGNTYTYDKVNRNIYFNQMCLCNNVSTFEVIKECLDGVNVLTLLVKFNNDNISYKTKYTLD